MTESSTAPVAIFAFNRPDKLRRLIDSLLTCELSDRTHFVFFVDGPRNDRDAPLVAEVVAIATSSGLASSEVRASTINMGLRRSVYNGVGILVKNYGRVIVLEDDLILSRIALRYFNESLDRYAHEESIWSICGYLWDVPKIANYSKALVLPLTNSWGWATWRRAWDRFELDARPSQVNLDSVTFKDLFDLHGLYLFTDMIKASIAKRVNSWYVHWNYTVFKHGGRSIFPPRRVLDNIGIGAGTHGGALNPYRFLVKEPPPLLDTMPELPDPSEVDYWALDALRDCWELKVTRFIATAGSLKRKLKRIR